MDGHRTAERRSVAYHRAIAERLVADPRLLTTARERVARWCETGEVHPRYAHAWRELLAGDVNSVAAALVAESERMMALRQSSPFAGVLDARTRWQIWRSVA